MMSLPISYLFLDQAFRSWQVGPLATNRTLILCSLGAITNFAEKPAMVNLQKTYGKTIHTWPVDVSPELPLGPPSLMMAYTSDEQVPHELVRERDERLGMDTEGQKKRREGYLPSYEKNNDADAWEKTGRGVEFMPH